MPSWYSDTLVVDSLPSHITAIRCHHTRRPHPLQLVLAQTANLPVWVQGVQGPQLAGVACTLDLKQVRALSRQILCVLPPDRLQAVRGGFQRPDTLIWQGECVTSQQIATRTTTTTLSHSNKAAD